MLVTGEDTDGMGPDWLYDDEFLSADDLELVDHEVEILRSKNANPQLWKNITYDFGVFPGQTMSNYIPVEGAFKWWIEDKVRKSGYIPYDFVCGGFNIVEQHKPADTHNDYQYKYFWGGKDWVPYMNFLLPLTNTSAHTIMFEQQCAEDESHFYKYKESNDPVDNPVPEEFWNKHCSHCWPEDRQYLTLRKVFPEQRRGLFVGLKSKFYHTANHFHDELEGTKGFLHLRLGIRR